MLKLGVDYTAAESRQAAGRGRVEPCLARIAATVCGIRATIQTVRRDLTMAGCYRGVPVRLEMDLPAP